MRPSRNSILLLVTAALAIAATAIAVLPNWWLHASEREVQSYLLDKTTLGSSEQQVIAYLRTSGAQFGEPWRGDVPAGNANGYPPNTIAGNSFITALVGEYRIVFVTSVEAFYIFDSNHRLVEIAVRKTTDAL